MYKIRNANREDLPRILEIYAHARGFMAKTGNPTQWPDHYPGEDLLTEDIQDGNLYVVCDEGIRGVFMFRIFQDPTYRYIWDGDWHCHSEYGVIHRVASDGAGGVFCAVLDFCAQKAGYLRIDTHEDNKVMQHVLEKSGFQRCGLILTDNGSPRIAFDRI